MKGKLFFIYFVTLQGFNLVGAENQNETISNTTEEFDPCTNNTILSNDWRQVNNTEVGDHCDTDIIKGWYRMLINGKPASLPSVCIKGPACGVRIPLHIQFISDPRPGERGDANVCGSFRLEGKWECCILSKRIQVKNCGDFYVYELVPLDRCNRGYCLIGEDHDVEHFTAKTGESVDLNDQLLHGTDLLSPKSPDHISPDSSVIDKHSINPRDLTSILEDKPTICEDGYVLCDDNKTCVLNTTICNDSLDCSDMSDERNCPNQPIVCEDGYVLCDDNKTCILNTTICNDSFDCLDMSDERNCPNQPIVCEDGYVLCDDNKTCILNTTICNDSFDCLDMSDERNCPIIANCPEGLYRCDDGRCIDRSIDNCDPTTTITNSRITTVNTQQTPTRIRPIVFTFSIPGNDRVTTSFHRNHGYNQSLQMQSQSKLPPNLDSSVSTSSQEIHHTEDISDYLSFDVTNVHSSTNTLAYDTTYGLFLTSLQPSSSTNININTSHYVSGVDSLTVSHLTSQSVTSSITLPQEFPYSVTNGPSHLITNSPETRETVSAFDEIIFEMLATTTLSLMDEKSEQFKVDIESLQTSQYIMKIESDIYNKSERILMSSQYDAIPTTASQQYFESVLHASSSKDVDVSAVDKETRVFYTSSFQTELISSLNIADISPNLVNTPPTPSSSQSDSSSQVIRYMSSDHTFLVKSLSTITVATPLLSLLPSQVSIPYSYIDVPIKSELEQSLLSSILPDRTTSYQISNYAVGDVIFVSSTVLYNTTIKPPEKGDIFKDNIELFSIGMAVGTLFIIVILIGSLCLRHKTLSRNWTCRQEKYYTRCEKDALMKPKETKTNVFQDDEMVLENYMIENASFYLSFEEIDKTAVSLPDDGLVIPINELAATDMSDKTENTQF